jgi:hypothetical protein
MSQNLSASTAASAAIRFCHPPPNKDATSAIQSPLLWKWKKKEERDVTEN